LKPRKKVLAQVQAKELHGVKEVSLQEKTLLMQTISLIITFIIMMTLQNLTTKNLKAKGVDTTRKTMSTRGARVTTWHLEGRTTERNRETQREAVIHQGQAVEAATKIPILTTNNRIIITHNKLQRDLQNIRKDSTTMGRVME
jgi:hypothetical protein